MGLTTQKAYEKMRAYLTRPGARRAVDEDSGECRYEIEMADGGIHQCAVGCILGPQALAELGRADFMGGLNGLLASSYLPLAQAMLSGVDERFLRDAQVLHDREYHWPDGVFNVRLLDDAAAKYGLEVVGE